jgi:D-sedoheptulose 7-phosphate isomerase
MEPKNEIQKIITDSISVKVDLGKSDKALVAIKQVCELFIQAINEDKRIWFCGNGGSASDAQHLAAELTGRFFLDRKALKAEALHCNSSYLTAVANDYGYNTVYSRLVEGIIDSNDVLVGLSTSGNSPNIVEAFKVAKSKGISTVLLTGENQETLIGKYSDISINVPSSITPRIQESHILIGHIICEIVEKSIFDSTC